MATIRDHLVFLYGESVAKSVRPRLQERIARHLAGKSAPLAATDRLPLTEADALLITYGDQVREPDAPPLRTLAAFLKDHLPAVLSGVHLLPFYPSSSDDGFSVIDYLAVDPQLGGWEDISSLGADFDLMFDAVFNHISAKSQWCRKFLDDDPAGRDFFVVVEGDPDLSLVVRPRALPLLTEFKGPSGGKKVWTTFSADQIDLNFKNPDVLLAVLDALLFYVEQGARFIRLDAVAYLWKEIGTSCIHLPQAHRVIQLMRSLLDEVAPHVLLITETNVPHADNVSYFGDGANEAQLVYNFALPPLVLHSLQTADATALIGWAETLRLPSRRTTFFNFLASHDGIGVNPVRGILQQHEIDALVERVQQHGGLVSYKHDSDGSKSPYELNVSYFDALSNPNDKTESLETQIDRFLAAHAVMLSIVGMPGIYFHSLFGSRGDRAGAEASGIPRRINRRKLTRAELDGDLRDPGSLRSRVFAGLGELLAARRQHRAFNPCGRQEIIRCDNRVFAVLRVSADEGERVVCLQNLANAPVALSFNLPGHEPVRRGTNLLGDRTHFLVEDGKLEMDLRPYQVEWILVD